MTTIFDGGRLVEQVDPPRPGQQMPPCSCQGSEHDECAEVIMCEQGCGEAATVYAIDPRPGGWGGKYCDACTVALRFQVVDQLGGAR